jgi:geranylgeranyl diphosphate synthase type I
MMDHTLGIAAKIVENRLESLFEQVQTSSLSEIFDTRFSSDVLNQVRELTLRAGKRLRPALLMNGAALFDESSARTSAVVDACAALELLHTYFLIHDDIMDDDDTRRGGPSAHAALSGISGERRLGSSLAILAGDLAVALHQFLLANLSAKPPLLQKVLGLFASMHLEVIHGQTLDLTGSSQAEQIAIRKTASYTTVGPLSIGATLADAPLREVKKIASIALPLGIAFQLRDDLIGVFGSFEVIGKPVGTDLKNGKRTFLVDKGLSLADQREKQLIEAVFGKRDAGDDEVARACEALVRCGALESCQNRIDELVEAFVQGVENGEYLAGGKRFLLEVARFIGSREK